MGIIIKKTGCDQYGIYTVPDEEIVPEKIGHSDDPIPVEIPEYAPAEAE